MQSTSPSRRGPLVVLTLAVVAAALVVGASLLRTPAPRCIVLVTVDTLRVDRVGAYGRTPSLTPRMDALADDGVVFETCWTPAPLTVPSHATVLAGVLPTRHGLRTNQPDRTLPDACATLAESFRDAGFRTGAFVSASVLRKDRTGLDAGFDVYDEVPAPAAGALHDAERPGEETVAAALDWVREGGDAPTFVWVHLFDPHWPYEAPPPFGAGPDHRSDGDGYDGEVRYADHCIGRLLDGLAAAEFDDPVVAVTSDHGEALGEHGERTHGWLLHEATLHVPLILSAPGTLGPGRRPEPVSLADLAPTLVTLARLPVPDGMEGRALPERKPAADRPLYAETLYGWQAFRWAQAFALRRGNRKWVEAGPFVLGYDLAADPREENPERVPAGRAADDPMVEALRTAAAVEPLAAGGAPSVDSAGSYWSLPGGSASPTLPPAENALLPSPYDRVADAQALAAAQALLANGAADKALRVFTRIAEESPGNPTAERWRGRALLALGRPAEAADAFRTAFEHGWRTPDCVARTLQAEIQAHQAADPAAFARARHFLADARGRGVPDARRTLLFEATIQFLEGDLAGSRATVDRARQAPPDPAADASLEQLERALEQAGTGLGPAPPDSGR